MGSRPTSQATSSTSTPISASTLLFNPAGHASVRRVSDGTTVARLPDASPPRELRFATDRWLAEQDNAGVLRVWDLSRPSPREQLRETGRIRFWDISADGRRLVASRRDGVLAVYDVSSGRRTAELPPGGVGRDARVSVHPFAPYVALSSYFTPDRFEIRHTGTGRTATVKLPWDTSGAYEGCWTDDGRTLAFSRVDVD